jgi:hypothetical protein
MSPFYIILDPNLLEKWAAISAWLAPAVPASVPSDYHHV